MVKRWSLRAALKLSRVGAWRISMGREFQRVGAATLKALSPKVRRLVQGVEISEMEYGDGEGQTVVGYIYTLATYLIHHQPQ